MVSPTCADPFTEVLKVWYFALWKVIFLEELPEPALELVIFNVIFVMILPR